VMLELFVAQPPEPWHVWFLGGFLAHALLMVVIAAAWLRLRRRDTSAVPSSLGDTAGPRQDETAPRNTSIAP